MKYKKLTGIILKKQNYREADQILTVWTKEAGKIRVLAKSIRKPASKLAYSVQDLGIAQIDIVGSKLPVLIGAKPIRQFQSLREDLQKTAIGLYGAELMLKMTADEHPNDQAYELLSDFLHDLDRLDYSVKYYPLLECFSLELLEYLGFKIPQDLNRQQVMEMESDEIERVHGTINKFIEYVLERPIWMTKF